jgi:hypothetical protein
MRFFSRRIELPNMVPVQWATSYMIEALRIYDHYRFRSAREDEKGKAKKVLELQLPPKKPSEKP